MRVADTYFSLGLEFDNGHRLPEDSRLIESEPLLFSSFYNLPCAGMSLAELNGIAAHFPLIVNLYPKSFLLLSLALEESVSRLFTELLSLVQAQEGLAVPNLTPAVCRKHLPFFVEKSLRETNISSWAHVLDIVNYENLFLDVARPLIGRSPATADLCRLHEQLPLRHESTVATNFEWNIADIISDLKNGIYQENYEKEASIIVAFQKEGGIELTEINEFGCDLLQLSNGSMAFEEIVGILHKKYGQDMDSKDFQTECATALAQLIELGTIVSRPEFGIKADMLL
ncbi:MAG: hypothetical protein EHM79_09185 [Geobacter sp.]|nr:MAG: hypothetical protein EHM79_09185 [Geobacter sp.]